MRTERETEPPQMERILGEGYEPWPRDWSGGGGADDERALRELREGLVRGRGPGGARWEVPVRAAVAAAVLAFAVVVVVVVLILRANGGDEGVAVGESAPLVSTSAVSSAASATDASAGIGEPGTQGVSGTQGTDGSVGGSGPVAVGAGAVPQAGVAGGAVQFRVHVVGQVREPGVVSLGSDARVQDAIEAAGGATGRADLTRINLARKVLDGERILVPRPGQKIPQEPQPGTGAGAPGAPGAPGGAGSAGASAGTSAGAAAVVPVDLNTATVSELDALPGVGPVLAGRIVEWRQSNGGFTTVDDLNEVSGIGDATMAKLRPLCRV